MKAMRKRLVNQKIEGLKEWPKNDLIHLIRNYPDQDHLNMDEEGNKRTHQIGIMAEVIEKNDYEMTDKQYYSLIDGFAKIVVPEMKVVGVSFRDLDPASYKKEKVGERNDGVVSTYDIDYHLKPEPENPYDSNAVGVWIETTDGELEQLGYLSKEFVNAHEVEEQVIQGLMVDHSNGKFKNVSYQIAIDTAEHLTHPDMSRLSNEQDYTPIKEEEYTHEDPILFDHLEWDLDDLASLDDKGLQQ